jgi:hypothetical protein
MKFYRQKYWLLTIFAMGCTPSAPSFEAYPSTIVAQGLEAQYDQAKYEAYKIMVGKDCKCKGVADGGELFNVDTIKILESDIRLRSLKYTNDTLIIFFDFFHPENLSLKPLAQGYGDCHGMIAIVSGAESKIPEFALIDGEGGIDVRDSTWDSIRTNNLLSCIASGQKVNPWLLEYIEAHDIKLY